MMRYNIPALIALSVSSYCDIPFYDTVICGCVTDISYTTTEKLLAQVRKKLREAENRI
jgi:hypothetical protein